MATRIKLRRGTSLQWASANPVLSLGEFGYESNTTRFKIGDGVTPWNELDYNEQIITLTGDASGSGNGLIQVTVHDDSHNHTTATLPNFTEDVQDVVGGMVVGNTEDGIVVTYDDETGKLNFNVDDPTITLTGDVSGSAQIVNLSDTTIDVTINPDSVALGTDTTGDYVQTITGTENQVIVDGEGTESRDVTLSLPQDIHSEAVPEFAGMVLPFSTVTSKKITLVDSSPAQLDSFLVSEYSTVEYLLQFKQGLKTKSEKIIVMWDGTDINFNEFSILENSGAGTLASASISINEGLGEAYLTVSCSDAATENVGVSVVTTKINS